MNIILFDGVCNLCNGTVNWIIDRDKRGEFKFASLQSDYGQHIIMRYNLQNQYLDTIVLIENDQAFIKSAAVLRILKRLGGIYSVATIFLLLPSFLPDFFYNIVARYRYSWFGKRDVCRVPDASLKEKFIE